MAIARLVPTSKKRDLVGQLKRTTFLGDASRRPLTFFYIADMPFDISPDKLKKGAAGIPIDG